MWEKELMRQVNGNAPVPRNKREVVARAAAVQKEVQSVGFMVDGALALAGHIMEGVVGLDDYRRFVAKDDPVHNALCADIEQMAVFKAKQLYSGLYSGWDL